MRVAVLTLLLFHCYLAEAGQLCSSCSGVTDQQSCQHHIKCEDYEECFVRHYETESGVRLYDLGCTTSSVCPGAAPSLVGKRDEGHHMLCLACCNNTGLCNQDVSCKSDHNQDSGQLCASCSGVPDQLSCQHHIKCGNYEECFVRHYETESGVRLYDMGCTTSSVCPGPISSGVGKRGEGHHMLCLACCNNTDLCNQVTPCESVQPTGTVFSTVPVMSYPRDCSELNLQVRLNGTYNIYPYGPNNKPVAVYCIFDYADVAWTVIQRRFDGSVEFYRVWSEYVSGFGSTKGEYWLGLENIHALTTISNSEVKFVMSNFDNVTTHATYTTFLVADASEKYRLNITGYSGTAGDTMKKHDGMMFSTYDQDNDIDSAYNCAFVFHGAWWYYGCFVAHLNGKYPNTKSTTTHTDMTWDGSCSDCNLKSSIIMIRQS